MSAPQDTIAIVYENLIPGYIAVRSRISCVWDYSEIFWRHCSELVRDHGYDNKSLA